MMTGKFSSFFSPHREKKEKFCGEKYLLSLPFFKGGKKNSFSCVFPTMVSLFSSSVFPLLFEMREKSKL